MLPNLLNLDWGTPVLFTAAWLATFLIHSTILLGGVWLVTRFRVFTSHLWKESLWKFALVGGIATATLQVGIGFQPYFGKIDMPGDLVAMALPEAEQQASPVHWITNTHNAEGKQVAPLVINRVSGESGNSVAASTNVSKLEPLVETKAANPTILVPESSAKPQTHVVNGDLTALPQDTDQFFYHVGEDGQSKLTIISRPDRDRGHTNGKAASAGKGETLGVFAKVEAWFVGIRNTIGSWDLISLQSLAWLSVLAVVLWMALAVWQLIRFSMLRLQLWRFLRGRRPVEDEEVLGILESLRERGGFRPKVLLSSLNRLMGPIAFGRREICVPDRALTLLSREQQQTALAHELAHLIRRDPFWLVFGGFLESLFFFQPLIRVARKEMRESAEYLCDDWAVRQTGGNVTLAKCLAEVASWNSKSHAEPIMASGMAGSPLVRRIQRLLDDKEIRATHISLRSRVAVACGLLGLVLVFAPGISTDRFEPQKSNAEILLSPADLTDWANPGHEDVPPMTAVPFGEALDEVDEEDAPEFTELFNDPPALDEEVAGPEEWSPLNLLAAIAPEKLKEENDRVVKRRVARDLRRAVERSRERSAARSWHKVYSLEPLPVTGYGSPDVPTFPTIPKTIQVPRPIIGVYTEDKKDYEGKIKGLVITDVMDGMPAKIAGIHTGDMVIAVDGQKPATFDLLKDRISHHGVDGGLMLTVARKNDVTDVLVTIGTDGKMIEVSAPTPRSDWRLAREQKPSFEGRYAETIQNATDVAAEYRAALDLAAIAGNESQFNNQKVLQKEVKDRLRQMYEQQKLLLQKQQTELEPLLAAMQNEANENGELDIQIDMEDLEDLKELWNDLQSEIENFGEYLEDLNLNVSINNENHPEHPFGPGADQSYGFSVGTDEDGHSVWEKINDSQNGFFYSTGQNEDDHEHDDDHDHKDDHAHSYGEMSGSDFRAWYEQEAADRLGVMLAQAILDQGVQVTRDMEEDLVDVVEHAVDHVLDDMSSSVSVRARVMRLNSSQTRIRSLLYAYFKHAADEEGLELSAKDHDKVKQAIREVVKQLSSNGMQVSW